MKCLVGVILLLALGISYGLPRTSIAEENLHNRPTKRTANNEERTHQDGVNFDNNSHSIGRQQGDVFNRDSGGHDPSDVPIIVSHRLNENLGLNENRDYDSGIQNDRVRNSFAGIPRNGVHGSFPPREVTEKRDINPFFNHIINSGQPSSGTELRDVNSGEPIISESGIYFDPNLDIYNSNSGSKIPKDEGTNHSPDAVQFSGYGNQRSISPEYLSTAFNQAQNTAQFVKENFERGYTKGNNGGEYMTGTGNLGHISPDFISTILKQVHNNQIFNGEQGTNYGYQEPVYDNFGGITGHYSLIPGGSQAHDGSVSNAIRYYDAKTGRFYTHIIVPDNYGPVNRGANPGYNGNNPTTRITYNSNSGAPGYMSSPKNYDINPDTSGAIRSVSGSNIFGYSPNVNIFGNEYHTQSSTWPGFTPVIDGLGSTTVTGTTGSNADNAYDDNRYIYPGFSDDNSSTSITDVSKYLDGSNAWTNKDSTTNILNLLSTFENRNGNVSVGGNNQTYSKNKIADAFSKFLASADNNGKSVDDSDKDKVLDLITRILASKNNDGSEVTAGANQTDYSALIAKLMASKYNDGNGSVDTENDGAADDNNDRYDEDKIAAVISQFLVDKNDDASNSTDGSDDSYQKDKVANLITSILASRNTNGNSTNDNFGSDKLETINKKVSLTGDSVNNRSADGSDNSDSNSSNITSLLTTFLSAKDDDETSYIDDKVTALITNILASKQGIIDETDDDESRNNTMALIAKALAKNDGAVDTYNKDKVITVIKKFLASKNVDTSIDGTNNNYNKDKIYALVTSILSCKDSDSNGLVDENSDSSSSNNTKAIIGVSVGPATESDDSDDNSSNISNSNDSNDDKGITKIIYADNESNSTDKTSGTSNGSDNDKAQTDINNNKNNTNNDNIDNGSTNSNEDINNGTNKDNINSANENDSIIKHNTNEKTTVVTTKISAVQENADNEPTDGTDDQNNSTIAEISTRSTRGDSGSSKVGNDKSSKITTITITISTKKSSTTDNGDSNNIAQGSDSQAAYSNRSGNGNENKSGVTCNGNTNCNDDDRSSDHVSSSQSSSLSRSQYTEQNVDSTKPGKTSEQASDNNDNDDSQSDSNVNKN